MYCDVGRGEGRRGGEAKMKRKKDRGKCRRRTTAAATTETIKKHKKKSIEQVSYNNEHNET